DAPAAVITDWRHAEGLPESPAEIVRAESDQLRKLCERYLVGDVLLDVLNRAPLRPGGEAPAARRCAAGGSAVEPHQLMRQDRAERFEIRSVARQGLFDKGHKLESRIPKRRILEEQPRSKRDLRIHRQLGRIEIEIGYARENVRFVPGVALMARRHEGELPSEIAQSRAWQSLDERLPVPALRFVVQSQQVNRRAEAEFKFVPSCGLDDLRCH